MEATLEGEGAALDDGRVAELSLEADACADVTGEPPRDIEVDASTEGEGGDRGGELAAVLECDACEGMKAKEEFQTCVSGEDRVMEADLWAKEDVCKSKRAFVRLAVGDPHTRAK